MVLVLADQWIGAVALALFSAFMAYWTNPLRAGDHLPLSAALADRGDEVTIVLWAPGDPLSARLQTAIRGPRHDVRWVNIYQDAEAQRFLAAHGGAGAVPLAIVGEDITPAVTVTQLLDMQAAGAERAKGRGPADG